MLAVLASPKYAYSLYEFVADSYCRERPIVRISLVRLKEFLGIPAASYADYKTFKFQVLKPTIAAINRISDYSVKYTTYREGRKVAGVIFHIERKRQWQQPLLLERPLAVLQRFFGVEPIAATKIDDAAIVDFIASVARYRIDEKTARAAVAAHGLLGAIEIRDKVVGEIARREKGSNPVRDGPAYLARCLREGYGMKTPEERVAEERSAAASAARRGEAAREKDEGERRLMLERQLRDKAKNYLAALPPEERAAYEERFLAAANEGVHGSHLRGKPISHPGVQRAFLSSMVRELSKTMKNTLP